MSWVKVWFTYYMIIISSNLKIKLTFSVHLSGYFYHEARKGILNIYIIPQGLIFLKMSTFLLNIKHYNMHLWLVSILYFQVSNVFLYLVLLIREDQLGVSLLTIEQLQTEEMQKKIMDKVQQGWNNHEKVPENPRKSSS